MSFKEATIAGRNWADVSDICVRVFLMKLKEFKNVVLADGRKKGLFGRVVAFAYSIELQQRGWQKKNN